MRIAREQRVSKDRPCPACGHTSAWCYFLAGGDAVWCGRVDSVGGCAGRPCKGGWIHQLSHNAVAAIRAVKAEASAVAKPNFERLGITWRRCADRGAVDRLAKSLGVSAESLRRLHVGWASALSLEQLETACRANGCWTFPMRDGTLRITGIRLRSPLDAFKYAVAGSDGSGLFVPDGLPISSDLFLPEGPTSTAALLGIGLHAVGRPNCSGGVTHIRAVCKRLRPRRIVVVGDNDKPDKRGRRAGQESAEKLVGELRWCAATVFAAFPPAEFKDVREWLRSGVQPADMAAALCDRRIVA